MLKIKAITKTQAINYVVKNARYSDDAPPQYAYSVRFPNPYASTIFFDGDTHELVEKLFKFGKTVNGKVLWSSVPLGKYDIEEEIIEED